MPLLKDRLSANLSFLFTEWPFLDRFAAAADAGFTSVEFLFPYAFTPDQVQARLEAHNLSVSVFNSPCGDWETGDRGLAALPGRRNEFRSSIATALRYAEAMKARRVHVMAGVSDTWTEEAGGTYRDNLALAAGLAAEMGVQVLIEPINGQDMPGYFLQDFALAGDIVGALPDGRLGLQFDIYHCRRINGGVLDWLDALLPLTTHMQIAGFPGRNEPAEPALPLAAIFSLLDARGYAGRVGCEYRPVGGTVEGMGWIGRTEEAMI